MFHVYICIQCILYKIAINLFLLIKKRRLKIEMVWSDECRGDAELV